MSIGYSALNKNLNISGDLTYRPKGDIRITNVTQATLTGATLQYADFSKNEINFAYESTTTSATIALTVEVTNYTDTEMGILKIENLPATATITGYTLKNKLTNANGPLTAGKSTTFTITLKPTAAETKTLILKFDFEPFYKVAYEGFSSISGYKTEVLKGDNFSQNVGTSTQICSVTMNGSAISNYTFSNGVIEIKNVTGNIIISAYFPVIETPTTPNPPELNGDMIPVYYDNGWKKANTSNPNNSWYDYANQKWANAVTVTASTRTTYKNANVGTLIPMDAINTMWVWIPRYSYTIKSEDGSNYYGKKSSCTIPTQTLPGEIDVKFIAKTTESETGSAQYTGDKASGWRTNEAFDFPETNGNGNNIPTKRGGIWVGKFETTGSLEKEGQACVNTSCNTNNVTIKPGINSMRDQTASSFFYMSRSMQLHNSSTYGFVANSGDLHMMKNDEWGAVAYLSQSRYGKYGNSDYTGANKEVYINNDETFVTGHSGGSPDAESSATIYEYNDMTNLGQGKGQVGPGASTTGNIYGIYDMSGGALEFVMGVIEYDAQGVNNHNGQIVSASSGFKGLDDNGNAEGSIDLPNSKYYNKYKTANPEAHDWTSAKSESACNGKVCYGHALSETVSSEGDGWYDDYVYMIYHRFPWIKRGGFYIYSTGAGMFTIYSASGADLVFKGSSCRLVFTP